jgi:hypothetical protein
LNRRRRMIMLILADSMNILSDAALVIEILVLAVVSFILRSKDKKLHQ